MRGGKTGWLCLITGNVLAWSVLVFSGKSTAVPPNQPPFANPVEQNIEIIRELKEIKGLLQDQNNLLRNNSVRKTEPASTAPQKNGNR